MREVGQGVRGEVRGGGGKALAVLWDDARLWNGGWGWIIITLVKVKFVCFLLKICA